MSSSLIIKLRKKTEKVDDAPAILILTTTPTRELYNEIDFVYDGGRSMFMTEEQEKELESSEHYKEYGDYTVLTLNKLNEIISFYDDKIKQFNDYIKKEYDQKCMIQEAFHNNGKIELLNEITERENSIASLQEELDEYKELRNKWEYSVKQVFIEANNLFDLDNLDGSKLKYELIYYCD